MGNLTYVQNMGDLSATNTQNQISFETKTIRELNILFQVFGTDGTTPSVFASQNAVIEGSFDNSVWVAIDSALGLGTGAALAKNYSDANRGATLSANPATFPYVRITVPQIASKRTKIWYCGK